MRKLWISCALAMALVVLIALGFMPVAGHASSSSESKPKAEKSATKGEGGGKKDGDSTYIHLSPIVVPMIGQGGAEQIVTLLIDLQVKDPSVSETVRSKMPRVQDALVQELYSGFSDGSLRQGDRVDIAKVKTRAAAALDKVLEGHVINDVLIQGVAQRML